MRLHEQIQELEGFIERHREFVQRESRNTSSKDANISWAASVLLARLMRAANDHYYSIGINELETLRDEFCQRNHVTIDLDALFGKYWLRNVLGRIRIAGKISYDLIEFKNVQPFLAELNFLIETERKYKLPEKDTITGLTKEIVEKEMTAYEAASGVRLNTDGIFYRRWYDPKDERFTSIDIYFKHFAEAANDFSYLLEVSHFITASAQLVITEQCAIELHTNHKVTYPATPGLDDIVASQLLIPVAGGYQLYARHGYWSDLRDQVSGHLWESLLLPDSENDARILLTWLEKIAHFDQVVDPISYVTSQAAKRFLDAALQCLLNEPDLDDSDKERMKLMLESRSGHPYAEKFSERAPHLKGTDVYTMYQDLDALDDHFQHNFLHEQPSRQELLVLIFILVLHDEQYSDPGNPEQVYFKRIFALLKESVFKPYLLFETTEVITNWKPQILPYFMTDIKFASLGLLLLDKIRTDKEDNTHARLWELSMALTVTMLQEKEVRGQEAALLIFRLLILMSQQRRGQSMSPAYNNTELTRKKDESVLAVLESQSVGTIYHGAGSKHFFIPTIFEGIADLFINYEENDRWKTSSVAFPLGKWIGLSWLLKLYFDIRYSLQMEDKAVAATSIAQSFLDSYSGFMKMERKKVFDYAEFKEVESDIYWNEDGSGIPMINWLYFAVLLYRNAKLSAFVSPTFHFRSADDKYDTYNKLTASKIRTHIVVLLELLKQLQEPASQVLFEKEILDAIAVETENAILALLQHHTHDPANAMFDVLEETHALNREEPLLARLAKTMYGFKKQSAFIHTIIDSGDMAKLLTLLDYVTSESLRSVIIKQIKEQNIEQTLKSYNWIPDVQHVFVRVVKYPELVAHTEKAIEYWSEKVSKRTSGQFKYKETLYNVQLFNAYLKKDKKGLQEVEPLADTFKNGNSGLNAKDYKDFYLGLLLMEDDPMTAYQLFHDVYSRKRQLITFGINRTVARLNHIKQKKNIIPTELQSAYQEWSIFRNGLTKAAIEELEPEITSVEISMLIKLKDYEQADRKFDELPAYQKFTADILEMQVQSLHERDRVNDALYLITQADDFHFYPGTPQPAFLAILKDRYIGIDNVQELQVSLLRIMEIEPDKLVKILPSSYNGKKEVVPFLVKEVTIAGSKMLDKIKSIEAINLENRYNDLVEALLNARITLWNWRVSGQSRGAFSESGKDAGERDLPIADKNDQMLLVCEAFILRDQKRTEEHLQKVFNYYHRRNAFCILVYDTGITTGSFEDHWQQYLNTVVPAVKFPEGFAFKGNCEEISREFHTDLSAIRVARTLHGTGTAIYHVFVNITYQVKTTP